MLYLAIVLNDGKINIKVKNFTNYCYMLHAT